MIMRNLIRPFLSNDMERLNIFFIKLIENVTKEYVTNESSMILRIRIGKSEVIDNIDSLLSQVQMGKERYQLNSRILVNNQEYNSVV